MTDLSDSARQALRPASRVVPLLGAGMSAGAGVPGADALASWLIARGTFVEPVPADSSLFHVVDALDPSRWDKQQLQAEVAGWIGGHAIGRSASLEALVRSPSRLIVTLNYDFSVEMTAQRLGISVSSLTWSSDDLTRAHEILRRAPLASDPLTVLHLHGIVSDPDSIVLDSQSYERLIRSTDVEDVIHGLVYYRTLLFLGTSLNEEYFVASLQKHRNRGPHVLICTPRRKSELTGGRLALTRARHGLWVETVPNHDALPAALISVIQPGGASATQPAIARPLLATETYVPNGFVDRASPVDEMDLIRSSLGLTPNAPIPDPVTEEDLAVWYRTLALGAAGSGKTELLLQLAKISRPDRPGVVIRLADVHVGSGDPARILARWAGDGRTAHTGLDVSLDAIRERPFHFLLDGLDEVPSDQQRPVAQVIRAMAEQLPQHAFTVTARPGSAAVVLGGEAEDWRVVEVTPGYEWQRRYLELRGVTLEELEGEMPALGDMGDLLTTPFFLSRTVQLHYEGRLRGLRNVGELLSALIDLALDREEPILEMETVAVRNWLRSVALAGALVGRRSFSAEELQQFDTPDGIGGPQQLAEILVQRLLLAEEDGNYRFSHRILGEQLAVEALVEHGPLEPLMDCIVPAPADDIAGVREDVRLIVGLAGLASTDWRRAVAARDPLAAMRATPTDAEVEERREAISTIWSIHSARGVWMWEYGTPTLVDDTEALARLMRSDPDGAPAQTIRRAIHEGNAQEQGNAIRVFALIDPSGFEDDLRRVLRDADRNGVVRRQAAIAAEKCGLIGLVDDIVELLEHAQDDVLRQDAALVLAKLVPGERQFEVMLKAARLARGDYLVDRLFARLTTEQRVLVAAEGAAVGEPLLTATSRTALGDAIRELAGAESADPPVTTALARLGTHARIDMTIARPLLASDPDAAIGGIRMALSEGAEWWDALRVAAIFDSEVLRAAELPEEVVDRVADMERHAADREAAGGDEVDAVGIAEDEYSDGNTDPTLAELLALPPEQSDQAVAYCGWVEPDKAAGLTDAEKDELVMRLERWGSNASGAWLGFGPALGLELSDERWAELATHSLHPEAQTEWLKSQCTAMGMARGAQLLASVDEPERWGQLLASCPGLIPQDVLETCANVVNGSAQPPHAYSHRHGLELIAERMLTSDAAPLARDLAARDERFHAVLVVQLARAGDVPAQEELLDAVIQELDEGGFPSGEGLTWAGGISDPQLLPRLFEILRRTWRTSDEPTRHMSSGAGIHDIVSPVISAIANIGGQEAIERYDALIAAGGGFRWLAEARANVVRELLRAAGTARAATAASAVGVLRLTADPSEE